MPLYTFATPYDNVEVIAESEELAIRELCATLGFSADQLSRVYEKPAGAVYKKTGKTRGTTRKSTWRKPVYRS